MKIYSLLKLNRFITNPRIKALGIWAFHVLNRRYLVVFFDPVLACNLRCRMCYFSNEEKRNNLKGHFSESDLERVGEVIFSQALKLQIGCGAEPTLFRHNPEIVRLAKQYGVPYVSLTTNANLLTPGEITRLSKAGLDEFTISLHGVRKETYEYLMQGASYEKFKEVLHWISEEKKQNPNLKLRINYTANDLNTDELSLFFKEFGHISVDVLQLRPIQDIEGEIRTADMGRFAKQFNHITLWLKEECAKRKISYIAPSHIEKTTKENPSSSIFESIYCYISPKTFWENDMDWRKETFREYSRRKKYGRQLFRRVFSRQRLTGNKLDYDIN